MDLYIRICIPAYHRINTIIWWNQTPCRHAVLILWYMPESRFFMKASSAPGSHEMLDKWKNAPPSHEMLGSQKMHLVAGSAAQIKALIVEFSGPHCWTEKALFWALIDFSQLFFQALMGKRNNGISGPNRWNSPGFSGPDGENEQCHFRP